MMREPAEALLKADPRAFMLLVLIACRARWNSDAVNIHGLQVGEALIGDHKAAGLTRQQYRSALRRLENYGFITSRATPKGTTAKLTSGEVFSLTPPPTSAKTRRVNLQKRREHARSTRKEKGKNQPPEQPTVSRCKTALEQPPEQPTPNHHPTNAQPLTKKEIRKQRNNVVDVARAHDPQLRASCEHIAATATDASLVEELQKLFPQHDVAQETAKYSKWCSDKGRTSSREGFVSWMLHARPPFKPTRRAPATPRPSKADDYVPPPLSEEDQADADRFNREREERKRSVFRENGLREVA